MGALADFLANQIVFDNSANADGVNRTIKRYFTELQEKQGDPAYPAGYDVTDAVHSIAQHVPTVSGGTFALTVTLRNGETFTTAVIAYDAVAGTIETAIDSAATTASITGWTNGDITVSGGDLNTAPVVLTFDGASVAGDNHVLTVIDGALLTGGGSAGVVTFTANGQTARSAYAVMNLINMFTGSPPLQGTIAPLDMTGVQGSMHLNPNADVIRALAAQAGVEDLNKAVENAILDDLRNNSVAV